MVGTSTSLWHGILFHITSWCDSGHNEPGIFLNKSAHIIYIHRILKTCNSKQTHNYHLIIRRSLENQYASERNVLNLQQTGLNVITELVIGYMYPGKPLANVTFKTYGYISMSQALSFLGDFKLGHYMKVPPKSMFIVQVLNFNYVESLRCSIFSIFTCD